MKVLAYLMFTLLSIIIQFSLMEFINASQITVSEPPKKVLGSTSPNKMFGDFIKEIKSQPHALFYQKRLAVKDSSVTETSYTNISLAEPVGFTDIPITSSVYDVFEDSSTVTDNDITSEPTTEYENFTDLSIFQQQNLTTTQKPILHPKTNIGEDDCYCNLLFNVCDTNCCCDRECSVTELGLFQCSSGEEARGESAAEFCLLEGRRSLHPAVDSLFCAVRTNVPDRRITNRQQYDIQEIDKLATETLKWRDYKREPYAPVYRDTPYSSGDLLWVLKNGSTYVIDIPVARINNYCSDRSPIRFLRDEHLKCNVAFKDLEMFTILKVVQETKVISALVNSTGNILNCSQHQCPAWSVEACGAAACARYDADAHEPNCTASLCRNIALSVHYTFHYDGAAITRASARLSLQDVSPRRHLYTQEITVTFRAANNVTDPISLSGNPGYIAGLPVVASRAPANHTDNFFSHHPRWERTLRYPESKDGVCILTNLTYKTVDFDSHKRAKCRFVSQQKRIANATKYCMNVQDELADFLLMNRKLMISPFGNPLHLADEEWVEMRVASPPVPRGSVAANSEITCTDIITKLSLTFAYGDVSESEKPKIKLLSAAAVWSTENLTSAEDAGLRPVLTVQTMFIDVTRDPVYTYAGRPRLDLYLPADFFFPFPSNAPSFTHSSLVVIVCLIVRRVVEQ